MFKMKKKTKKRMKKKNHLPIRINILFLMIFLILSTLILRLGYIQIFKGEEYESQVASQANKTITHSVPRGIIYDRNNNVVVGNSPQRTITYTRSDSVSTSDMLEIAEKLAELIEMDISNLKERDKKDYWIMLHPDEAKTLVSDEKKNEITATGEKEGKSVSEINDEIYQQQLKKITKKKLAELTDYDLKVLAIYAKMNGGSANTTITIKSGDASSIEDEDEIEEEFARVSEYLEGLPGIDATTDWERTYPYEDTLRTVLGKVSSNDEGLPSEKLNYYLVRGYSRNDRVGTSYLEESYEDILHGTEKILEVNIDDNGNINDYTVLYNGQSGDNLILTLDIELQQKIEEIVEEKLWAAYRESSTADRAFVVMMDPNTGEVLAMIGKQIVTDDKTGEKKMQDYALGTISSAYEAGSAVKGATLLAVWQSGAMQPWNVLVDEKLQIKGTPLKGSYTNMGRINHLTALQKSSNVYMMKSIIAMGEGTYVRNQPLSLDSNLLNDLRYYFNQFGLGVLTRIDLANETEGYIGDYEVTKSLDFSIGQYDTYTAMQLAQYISTIANGGYRMKPQIIKAITEANSEKVIEEISPVILNKVEMQDEWIQQIQHGFRLVFQNGGTAYSNFADTDYTIAGKTGTAQATKDGIDVENSTMVAYAPYDNPEIAISVITPWVKKNSTTSKTITREALDTYFGSQNALDDSNAEE